jgi:hypothetical protein
VRDYIYTDRAGRTMPVAEMPSAAIQELLREGFSTDNVTPPTAITERLRLELFIREKGLRT